MAHLLPSSQELADDLSPLRVVQPGADILERLPAVRRQHPQIGGEDPLQPFDLALVPFRATVSWYSPFTASPFSRIEKIHPSAYGSSCTMDGSAPTFGLTA